MTYGTYQRAKARINVLRGFTGNEPQSRARVAKPKLNEGIMSGMIISLDDNGQWVKGVPAGSEPFFAYSDQSATDVQSSGLLQGLSCSGQFTLETGYFVDGSYTPSTPLKASTGTPGSIEETGLSDGDDIIGFCAAGLLNTINSNSGVTPVNGAVNVVQLNTNWQPVHS